MKKCQKWSKSIFWTIVENQWSNNVRGVTSSHKSVKLVLCECFGLCSNKKYFRIYFGQKVNLSASIDSNWPKSSIFSISEKVEKSVLEKSEHTFFHQLLMLARVSKAYPKTRLIGATFLPQTYVHPYILQTITAMASPCDPGEMRRIINVGGITSSYESVILVLCECFGLCSNKKYFSDLFWPKSPFCGQDWLKLAKIYIICHFCGSNPWYTFFSVGTK